MLGKQSPSPATSSFFFWYLSRHMDRPLRQKRDTESCKESSLALLHQVCPGLDYLATLFHAQKNTGVLALLFPPVAPE